MRVVDYRKALAESLVRMVYAGRGKFPYYRKLFSKTQWISQDELCDYQNGRLRSIVSWVYQNNSFYRERFDRTGLTPEDIRTKEDLSHLPILEKHEVQHAVQYPSKWFSRLTTSIRNTSGSSGNPLSLVKDFGALSAMDAIMYRDYEWFDISPVDRQARFWGMSLRPVSRLKIRFKDFLLNRFRMSPFEITERQTLDFFRKLWRSNTRFVYGYAQTLYQVAQILHHKGISLPSGHINAVIVTGEMLFKHQQELIKEVFHTKVVREYGATEVGIIAMECPQGNFHLMEDNLIVEFINKSPQSQALEGGEIVVTELHGTVLPLLRYRLGDWAKRSHIRCSCGRGLGLMLELQGRSDEFIILPSGKRVDPYFFEYVIAELPGSLGEIHQFQILQDRPNHLLIRMVVGKAFSEGALILLRKRIQAYLDSQTKLDISLVNFIERHPSGKLKCFLRTC